ncbi:MAG TPA: response regulator [Anaerolineae bacterium]|nr:response regulator [Anaerolineae bacterium]
MDAQPRILVIDDNRSLVRLIEGILRKEGYQVRTAFDGLDGLEKAQKEKPDLLILDIVMPLMDGYEVCRLLQQNPDTASIPVLMLTVKGQVDDPHLSEDTLGSHIQERMAGYEVGAAEFLSKPVKAKELVDRVKKLLWLSQV